MKPASSSLSTGAPLLVAGCLMALTFAGGLALAPATPRATVPNLVQPLACPPPSRAHARLELLFGTTKPGGVIVTDAEWQAFLDGEVTPRFPDGLTVMTGAGQWRNAKGIIFREAARVLLIWHIPGPRTEADIAAIRDTYRQRFQQESVMRVDSASCVGF